jgi:hypothetical protein
VQASLLPKTNAHKEDTIMYNLHAMLTLWLATLRRIAERHPAVFSVSAWSAPQDKMTR